MATHDLVFTDTTGTSSDLVFGGVTRDTDLVFSQPQASHPTDLVFGAGGSEVHPDRTATIAVLLPSLQGSVGVAIGFRVEIAGVMPNLQGGLAILHVNNTQRPDVGMVTPVAQVTTFIRAGVDQHWQQGMSFLSGVQQEAQDAHPNYAGSEFAFEMAQPESQYTTPRFQEGVSKGQSYTVRGRFQEGREDVRLYTSNSFQEGVPHRRGNWMRFQDGLRDRRVNTYPRWQETTPQITPYTGKAGPAKQQHVPRYSIYQEAWPPRPGVSPRPVPPVVPPPYWGTVLLFQCPPLEFPNLVFGGKTPCDTDTQGAIVVPVRKVYIVINSATLHRVEGNIPLPVKNMSLSLDVDSWTWQFSAGLAARCLPDLEPSSTGAPVEVSAVVNGIAFRFLVEGISRDREFGASSISIQGRGKTALLDTPYSLEQSFTNAGARTAQQIMGDILTVNNVPMGWDIGFNLTDWLIPAGVFSAQGSYISALKKVSESVGAYLLPDPVLQAFSVNPRYPILPWEWNLAVPDIDLPSSVTLKEAIAWEEKPRYNRVYVSGVESGVLGQVTINGTAGDVLAPMVTDSLITQAVAARQRGISILANTGRKARVTLSLPILPTTGVIQPGKFVAYTDAGVSRIGIVRSVSVETNLPVIRQTIGVETHVN